MDTEQIPESTSPKSPVESDPLSDKGNTVEGSQPVLNNAPETTETVPLSLKSLTDQALHFLATASNETLGACLIGIGATTYLVLGRAGLLLIGVVGGVVLHASWENGMQRVGDPQSGEPAQLKRRETGLEVVQRILDWRSRHSNDNEECEKVLSPHEIDLYSGKLLDYSSLEPQVATALNDLTDAVIRDYIKWWYLPIIPSETSFPAACRQTLTAFILQVSTHMSRKRPADTFLDFITNSCSIIIVFLNEISGALAGSPTSTPSKAIDDYLKSKPESSLGNVLDQKNQDQKLRLVAEDMLQSFLDPKTYNCSPAHAFLREILSKVVLEMTIQRCSKPEWINQWIVYLLEDGEPELMNVIDAGVEGSTKKTLQKAVEQIALHETELSNARGSKSPTTVSKAQEAMDEAIREARRLTQLIAEEDARRQREQQAAPAGLRDDVSESTTQGVVTPTSSQDEGVAEIEPMPPKNLPIDSPSQISPGTVEMAPSSFVNFDQLVPSAPPTALSLDVSPVDPSAFTLYNANISIFDDSAPGEKGIIRTRPMTDYLIQVEPASSQYPGWMIARKFENFEVLHEVLGRISRISGIVGFAEAHPSLPHWKGHTKASLRGELERYVNDALRFRQLAESEGMKRFLEKDNALMKASNASKMGFGVIPAAFENMGKGMMDVITKAPKEVAGGGKALFGGVTGVLGSVGSLGQRRNNSTSSLPGRPTPSTNRMSLNPIHTRAESVVGPLPMSRKSQDSLRSLSVVDSQPSRVPQMERRPSWNPEELASRPSTSSRSSARQSREHSRAPSTRESMDLSPSFSGDQLLMLPPLPSDIPDDYGSPATNSSTQNGEDLIHSAFTPAVGELSTITSPDMPSTRPNRTETITSIQSSLKKPKAPLKEQETQVVIELIFAVINELYTLSSAWQIRKTLLTATKTFLLRPGNPQLESIRVLLQESLLDAHTSEEGITAHLKKLRQNVLPTEEELKDWPPQISDEEKEALRIKARRLLVERGMPQALTSVMGQAASGEALGKVFDCLQVEQVARGLMFALLLQAMRAIAQ